MSKRFLLAVLTGLLVLTPLTGIVSASDPADGWLASGDPVVKFTEFPASTVADPASNTDCDVTNFPMIIREAKATPTPPFFQTELRHTAACAVQTPRGLHDGIYLEAGMPAGKFAGHSGQVVRVPNSNKLLTWRTQIANVALQFAWYDAIVPEYDAVTGEVTYNMAGHALFQNQAGNPFYIRPGSYGFSSNGNWMVADSSLGFIRVNLATREVLPFAAGFTYGQGQNPGTVVAISDDGRYAARGNVTSQGSTFRIYDLATCDEPPEVITGPVNCAFKDVKPFLQQTLTDYFGSYTVRFVTPELLTFTSASRDSAGNVKHFSARMVPNGQTIEDVSYLALGDSFSSGEGAYDYELGTDENGHRMWPDGEGGFFQQTAKNKCHLSRNSYPYIAAQELGISGEFHSVACSGAVMKDYALPQDDREEVTTSPLGTWLPGYDAQSRHVWSANPNVITITMFGNDINFSDKVTRCVVFPDTCYESLESRQVVAREIYDKFHDLAGLYAQIKQDAPNAKIYVLGYPQIVSNGNCGVNVHLNSQEIQMARGLTKYLNVFIQTATENAGVQYIDVENAFAGHQLCDGSVKAVNGMTAGDDLLFDIGPIGMESYHPNQLGHQLMAQELLEQSQNFTATMPLPSTVAIPFMESPEYAEFIADAPSVSPALQEFLLQNCDVLQLRGRTVAPRTEVMLQANTTSDATLFSTPTPLGTLTTNAHGELTGELTIPDSVDPGYHTLHIFAKDSTGRDIDLYKIIYVAASEDDIDGDGTPNAEEKCLAVEPANEDYDRDGIDDACDGEIGEPPADDVPPFVTGTPDRESNANGWYSGDVTITWGATDEEPSSGSLTTPVPTVANLEGTNTYVSEEACDAAENCATGNLELKIDKTAPTIGAPVWSCTIACNAKNLTITANISDELSGVANAEYYLGSSDPGQGNAIQLQIVNGAVTIKPGTNIPAGNHKLTIRAQDSAGNWSIVTEQIKVNSLFGTKLISRQPTTVIRQIITTIIAVIENILGKLFK